MERRHRDLLSRTRRAGHQRLVDDFGPDREAGYALVLVALLLVMFMVFAAFAVDLGIVYSARRQDQNGADAGALAGAQDLTLGDAQTVNDVRQYLADTLGVTQASLNLNSCAGDSGALPSVLVDGTGQAQNCLTRQSQTFLRVRVPVRQVQAVFGQVIGRASYDHTAIAIAGLKRQGFGGVLPFALFGTGSGRVCLRTDNPSSPQAPCQGTVTGNSGTLDFGTAGNPTLGTTYDCAGNGASPNGRMANNIAVGVDHPVQLRPDLTAAIVVDNPSACTATPPYPAQPFSAQVNAAQTVPSSGSSQALQCGLVGGSSTTCGVAPFSDGGPARLQRPIAATRVPYNEGQQSVEALSLDNTPLWDFIDPNLTVSGNVPSQCLQSVFKNALPPTNSYPVDGVNWASYSPEVRMEKLLDRCFALYASGAWYDASIQVGGLPSTPANGNPIETRTPSDCGGIGVPKACTGVLFGRRTPKNSPQTWDIQWSPRFAYVPTAWETLGSCGSGSTCTISFKVFQPVFIQRLCLGNQNCSEGTFSPGVPYQDAKPNSDNSNVPAISAYSFLSSMLPGKLGDPNAPNEINVNVVVSLVR